MRQGNRNHITKEKKVARLKYAERQIEKWIKWSLQNRGYVKYKEIVEIHDKYNIKRVLQILFLHKILYLEVILDKNQC